MSIEALTTFFGWLAALNIGYLAVVTLIMIGCRDWMAGFHQRLFGIDERDLKLAYFNWVGNYKIVTLVFTLAPYIALKLM